MDEGENEVDSLVPISYPDITPAIARASGFKGVIDLLKVARHGRGGNVMNASDRAGERQWAWPRLLGAVSFATLTSVALFYVIWVVVPYHAERLADLGARLSPPTAFAFFLANWFIRLLPILVLLFLLVGTVLLVLLLVGSRRVPRGRVIRVLGVAALGVALLQLLATAFLVLAMRLSG